MLNDFEVLAVCGMAWLVLAWIGYMIGRTKGREGAGFMLGFFLGPIGLVIVALLSDARNPCPMCRKGNPPDAVKCGHCGSWLYPEDKLEQCPFCTALTPTSQAVCIRCGKVPLRSAKPKIKGRTLTEPCPNCGAPVPLDELMQGSYQCRACGVVLEPVDDGPQEATA